MEHPGKFQNTSFINRTRNARCGETYIYDGRINRNQPLPTGYSGRYHDNGKRDARFGETPYIYDGRINRNQALPTEYSGRYHDTSFANGNRDSRFEDMSYISDGRLSRNQISPIEEEKFYDTSFPNGKRDARFEEMYISDGRKSRNHIVQHQKRFHDPTFANGRSRDEEMSYIPEGRFSKNQVSPLEHPRSYEEPPSQTMSRNAKHEVKQKIRRMAWIVITRICAAILILLDCVFDWLQYSDMKNDQETFIDEASCTQKEDIVKKYMYFTIAGTGLAVIQIANILFQIYCEFRFKNDLKEKIGKKMKYPMKLLDGRTETFYSIILIEIPQALLTAGQHRICLSKCKEKSSKKLIKTIINGGVAFLSNAWRYITSESCCEESCEFEGGCNENCYSCRPERREYLIPCAVCGKKCVCDNCKPSCEPWSYDISLCCCTFVYCPLNDIDDPKSCRKCAKVEYGCCKSSDNSYEPFPFHTFLAKIANILYVYIYAVNLFKLFCKDTTIFSIVFDVLFSQL